MLNQYTFRALSFSLDRTKELVPSTLAKPGVRIAKNIIIMQCLVTLFCGGVSLLLWDKNSAISAIYGGMVGVIPNAIFALYAFRYAGASQIHLVYKSFKLGSKLKLLLTIVLFFLIFRWPSVQGLPLIGTFVIVILTQWLGLLRKQDV